VISQFLVRIPRLNHLTLERLLAAIFFMASFMISAPWVCAQEDANDIPLGDLARSFRKKPLASDAVIDNDNLSKVVDDAESRRAAGAPVFSLDSGAKGAHVSSPDVSCSLSFTGKTASPFSDPLLLDDLPRAELAKLDGPATIDGDSMQVSVHNGTSWELREVVIGLTIVRRSEISNGSYYYGQARIVPAVAGVSPQAQDSYQKQPDVTLLLHVKGSAAPSATATFRTALNFALFPDQEWHWAIVKAKGIPPPPSPETMTQVEKNTSPVSVGTSDGSTPVLPLSPPLATPNLSSSVAPDSARP
jgi:hypothetical protein